MKGDVVCFFFVTITVKPILSGDSKIDKTKISMTNGSYEMQAFMAYT